MNKHQFKLIQSVLRDYNHNHNLYISSGGANTQSNISRVITNNIRFNSRKSSTFYNRNQQQQQQGNNQRYFSSFSTYRSSSTTGSHNTYNNNYQSYNKKSKTSSDNSKSINSNTKLKTLGVLLSPTFLLSTNNTTPTTMIEDPTAGVAIVAADPSNAINGVVGSLKSFFSSSSSDDIDQQQNHQVVDEAEKEMIDLNNNNNNNECSSRDNNVVDETTETNHNNSNNNNNNNNNITMVDSMEQDIIDKEDENSIQEGEEEDSSLELVDGADELNFASWSRARGLIKGNRGQDQESRLQDDTDENGIKREKQDLHFHSGICVIPHPNKRHKGGEDAHFVSNDRRVLGVADGVGGWGDVGIDPSLYSNTLMEGSKIASNDENEQRHPVNIMEKGYIYSQDIKGSSTCCIVVLDDDNLVSANLGDSGFLIIRENEIYFRTREQQHAFNMPFQLGTQSIDRPIHSITASFEVEQGDIIVLGTDGVFDNLFDDEICRITSKNSTEPQTMARMIAKRAYEVGNSTSIFTPFAKNAGLNGYLYNGGKLDDITVIVGIVAQGPMKPLQSDILLVDEDFLGDD